MANVDIGSAYVTIVPAMQKGVVSKIASSLGAVANVGGSAGKKFGTSFSQQASSKIGTLAVTAGNVLASGVSKAMGAVASSMSSAVSRYDTLNNFPKVMQNLGISSDEATKSINKMSDKLTGLPTTLDAGASAVQRFTSANNDVNKSTDYFLALNNAILAGGASTEIQSSALEQLSQAYSKGKMDMMEWRTLQMAMPAQLNQVAQAMGITTDALGEGLRGGTISMDDFMATIVKLNDEGVGEFASFSEQATGAIGGIGTAVTVFQTQITKGVTSTIQGIDNMLTNSGLNTIAGTISSASSSIKQFGVELGNSISNVNLSSFVSQIKGTVSLVKQSTSQYLEPMETALGGIGDKLKEVYDSAYPVVQRLIIDLAPVAMQLVEQLAKAVQMALGWVSEAFKAVEPLIPVLTTAIGACASAVTQFVEAVSGLPAPLQVAITALTLIGGKLLIVTARMGVTKLLQYAKAWVSLGKTFNTIQGKIGTITKKLTPLDTAVKKTSTSTAKSTTNILKYAGAIALLGAGVALIASAFWIMAQACQTLATAGTAAQVMFAVMLVSIPLLALVMASLGTALTAGSVGMLAFGGAILMVCTGLALVITALGVFSPQLQALVTVIGAQVVSIISAIGIQLVALVTAIGGQIQAIVRSVGSVIEGIVSTVGDAITGIINSISSGIIGIINSLGSLISSIIQTVGETIQGIIDSVAGGIKTACEGIEGVVRGIGDSISGIFDSIFNGISNVIDSIFNGIGTAGWAIDTIASKSWEASAGLIAFTGSATACSFALGDAGSKFGSLGSSMSSCSGALNVCTATMKSAQSIVQALNVALTGCVTQFNNFTSNVSNAMNRASSLVQQKMEEIKRAVNNAKLEATVKISVGKLPHFKIDGEFDAETKKVPSVSVDWYKRGGVFTSPSIIGVGEAGNEAVLPLNNKTYQAIADGISGNSNGSNTFNIALNYKAGDSANAIFTQLVDKLERYTNIRG